MVISKSLVPPGGWKFHESEFTLEAPTFDKLVELVADHRSANNKPAGDPKSEIMVQIGTRNPSFVLNQPPSMAANITNKIQSFATALKNYILSGGKLVDQNTANIRAKTCSSCHNNKDEPGVVGCVPCAKLAGAGVQFIRASVLAGRKTPHEMKLKSCALCGCDIRLKIWFPVKYFDPNSVEINKWPTFCWMKDNQ